MSERTRAMRTRQTAAFLTVALMTAVGANAQTPTPAPKPNPNPIQVLVPITPPVVTIPDIPVLVDLPMLRVDLDAIRATTNDAMERARLAMADMRLDMFDMVDWQAQTPMVMKGPRSGVEAAYIAGKDMLAAPKRSRSSTVWSPRKARMRMARCTGRPTRNSGWPNPTTRSRRSQRFGRTFRPAGTSATPRSSKPMRVAGPGSR